MKRNGFFSFRYSFKKESTSFLRILATFLSRKFGRLFFLDKRLKNSSHFLKLLMQKFFFCGCMRAKPVNRALTLYMYTCAFNSFANSIHCERNGYKLSTQRSFGCLENHRPIKAKACPPKRPHKSLRRNLVPLPHLTDTLRASWHIRPSQSPSTYLS